MQRSTETRNSDLRLGKNKGNGIPTRIGLLNPELHGASTEQ